MLLFIVNEVDPGLWAIVELNLWVIVASIPALRSLVNKILSDRETYSKSSPSQRYAKSKSSESGNSKPNVSLRYLGHKKGQLFTNDDETGNYSALKHEDATANGTWPETKERCYVRVSAPDGRESGWTPLDDDNTTEMERRAEISRPKSAHRMV